MPETTKPSQTPQNQNPSSVEKPPVDKKLDHIADDAAKQAGRTEKRFDGDHDIFTK